MREQLSNGKQKGNVTARSRLCCNVNCEKDSSSSCFLSSLPKYFYGNSNENDSPRRMNATTSFFSSFSFSHLFKMHLQLFFLSYCLKITEKVAFFIKGNVVYFCINFSCLFTVSALCLQFQLFVYSFSCFFTFLVRNAAVCLQFCVLFHLFVYTSGADFNCLFTSLMRISAVCLNSLFTYLVLYLAVCLLFSVLFLLFVYIFFNANFSCLFTFYYVLQLLFTFSVQT